MYADTGHRRTALTIGFMHPNHHPRQGNYWMWAWNGTAISWDANGYGQTPNINFYNIFPTLLTMGRSQ